MSYLRWSEESDVYMYHHVNGYIECCGCCLAGGKSVALLSRSDAISHLKRHKKERHKVPNYAIKRLKDEIKEKGEKLDYNIKT